VTTSSESTPSPARHTRSKGPRRLSQDLHPGRPPELRVHPLRQKIALVRPRLQEAAHHVWTHPRLHDFYPELLIRFHWMIRASVPLMEAARQRAVELAPGDVVAGLLADYLARHIPEETGHDEWLLQDLEVLGVKRSAVLARTPLPTMASLAGCQYYWIHHAHPVALLGYIAVLEGNPAPIEFIEEVVTRTGLPKSAFRSMFNHAALDLRHRDDLDEVLWQLPLKPEHQALMGVSAITTVNLFAQMFEEIAAIEAAR
jgi:hypothetical protein